MHAIVMVHKMQRMALSSHQLLPANAGAGADSENTRNSENVDVDDQYVEHEVVEPHDSWKLCK